jgi:hypothetical protein
MANVINATSTGNGGLVSTGDDSGILNIQTNETTAITVDASQNVGIGTTSPAVKLHVTTSTGELARFNASTTGTGHVLITNSNNTTEGLKLAYTNSDGSAFLGTVYSAYLGFITGNTERMRIDDSGNLFVDCTTTPNGSTRRGFEVVANTGINDTTKILLATTTSSTRALAEFNNANGNVGSIAVSGSSTSYATSSDYRLKENITPMTSALAKVAQLKPVTYKWKVDGSDGEGFIAHELAEVVPQCVSGEKDAVETYTDEDGNEQTRPKYQGIDTSFLVATLTAAIQELKAINDTQAELISGQAETINALTARIVALEGQ